MTNNNSIAMNTLPEMPKLYAVGNGNVDFKDGVPNKNFILENDIQKGIEHDEFVLFYQPLFSLETSKIVAVEALVRWHHPEKGFIAPDKFIPMAEQTNQIYALERWIVQTALQQKKQWEEEGLTDLELSINLSGKTLESELDFKRIEQLIGAFKVEFSKIIFEITETFRITDFNFVLDRLQRLKSLGVKIALDDFGTGFSSLSHLAKLPIDILKIDKSFIKSIPVRHQEKVITKNIVAMAHDLGCQVVAEGIELQNQMDYLQKIACDRGQGYLLCIPLPPDKLSEFLKYKL